MPTPTPFYINWSKSNLINMVELYRFYSKLKDEVITPPTYSFNCFKTVFFVLTRHFTFGHFPCSFSPLVSCWDKCNTSKWLCSTNHWSKYTTPDFTFYQFWWWIFLTRVWLNWWHIAILSNFACSIERLFLGFLKRTCFIFSK